MRPLFKIVVPTDFSDCSIEALREAIQMAKPTDALIYVVHVVGETSTPTVSRHVNRIREALKEELLSQVDVGFASIEPFLKDCKHEKVVLEGHAATAIVNYAAKVDADLIAIATHGRRGLARFLLGSTTQEVVRKARCPVLTVRPTPAATGACVCKEPNCTCLRESVDYKTVADVRGTAILVRDAMRRDVVMADPDTKLSEVVALMIHHDISGLPIVDKDQNLLGYVAERQLLARSLAELDDSDETRNTAEHFIEHQRRLHAKIAADVMTPRKDVVCIAEHAPLAESVKLMLAKGVSRLPVLRGEKVVGYLTRADVLRVLRNLEFHHGTRELDDEAVAELVHGAIERTPGLSIEGLRVLADHGVVHIYGGATDVDEIEKVSAAARRLPGVNLVDNCMLVEHILH